MEPPNQLDLSDEQRQQLMTYMEELEEQRTSDPTAFQKTMESLGLQSPMSSSGLGNQEGNLVDLANAIGELRTSSNSDSSPSIDISLPGGKSFLGKAGVENKQKGITITPEQGFTLKTKVALDGVKVFINLCTHGEIDAPSVKKKLNAEGESVEGMNVPLSVGPQYHENDHAGKDCIVYDIIVNPKVLLDATSDVTGQYRDFLCHLCIQSVEQKYPTHGMLDRQYKLPKLQYMGSTVRSQYIRDKRSIPKIQEVSETVVPKQEVKKSSNIGAKAAYVEADKEIPFRLSWIRRKITEVVSNENTVTVSEHETPILFSSKSNGTEYIEPIVVPDEDVLRVSLFVSLSGTVNEKEIDAKVSPFKFQLKCPGYKLLSLHLPCAILPTRTSSSLSRPEGFVNRIEYCLSSEVDRSSWGDKYDVGSKPWLVGQALSASEGEDCVGVYGGESPVTATEEGGSRDDYPEDNFHIKLPHGVDKYTGQPREGDIEAEEFPEDSFHRKDASSSYLINQREQGVKDKWAKHEKEKLDRLSDPDSNIEYVDVDDYKPGGRLGPPLAMVPGTDSEGVKPELSKASVIVASAFKDSEIGNLLSSNLWTELLD